MKVNERPRYRLRFEQVEIGVAETPEKAIEDMRQVMGFEAHVNGYLKINRFDVYDVKTDCVIARSRDYDPLPIV